MTSAFTRALAHRHFPLAAAALLGAVLIFSRLGLNGIANYDDCFYAQKAKEMLAGGSWMTLHHAGNPSFENPPGFIWLQAISYTIFGVGDFGAIFPSALSGVMTIILVYFFSRELSGPGAAGPSAFVMATTFFFIKYARHAMIDVTLALFVTLALYSAVLALRRDRRYFLLWGAASAFCVLMKSVLGLFPPLITVAFLAATGRHRVLFDRRFLAGSLLVVVPGCSWYIHEYIAFGAAFTRLHFDWLIYQRGFQGGALPWYAHLSYAADILTTYWPWLPLLAWGAARLFRPARNGDDAAVLLLLWPALFIVVMSLMQTRSPWYIMPAYPAMAMICGNLIGAILGHRAARNAARAVALGAVVAALVVNLVPVELSSARETDVRTLAPFVRSRARSGAKIVGYRFEFHSVNNALLFYSDFPARPVFSDPDEVRSAMDVDSPVLCVLYSSQLDSLLPQLPGASVIVTTGSLSLLSNGR